MSKHPKSIFSNLTWKDEDGKGGVRNLYYFFYYLLATHNMPRQADERTEDQKQIRRKAGLTNLERMHSIEARIKNGNYPLNSF